MARVPEASTPDLPAGLFSGGNIALDTRLENFIIHSLMRF
jgi:hypothetical protein